jgi:hypothetical protein
VERILTLGAQGYQDPEIARIVSAEGFRSARSAHIPASLVGEIRRARGQISLTEQFKTQAKVEGQWTIFGLAKATVSPSQLAVHPHTPRHAPGDSPQRHRPLLDRR